MTKALQRVLVIVGLSCCAQVTATQFVHTRMGNGNGGFNGDGDLAVKTSLDRPVDVGVDALGNTYVLDAGTGRVRRISNSGIVSTFAQGLSTESDALAVDLNGNVFVAADGDITRIDSMGDAQSIRSGLGLSGQGIDVDRSGNLYVADTPNHRILKILPTGESFTIAGGNARGHCGDGGPAVLACLNYPYDVAIAASGAIFIADHHNKAIRRVSPEGVITSVSYDSSGYAERIAVDRDENVYIAGSVGVLKMVPNGDASFVAGGTLFTDDIGTRYVTGYGGDGGNAEDALFDGVVGVYVDAASNLLIADSNNHRIRRVPMQDMAPSEFGQDSISDVLWRNRATGASTIWRNASAETQTPVTRVGSTWQTVGFGDFDGDSVSDLMWRNVADGRNAIWLSADSGTTRRVSRVSDLSWQVAGIADFDGDARADVLWRNQRTGANRIWWQADSSRQKALIGVTNTDWQIASVGDYSGDARADIFWRDTSTGKNVIWVSGNAAMKLLAPAVNLDWKTEGSADFDADGRSDVLWRNHVTGANTIWLSGNAGSQRRLSGARPGWVVAAIGRFDADARADILWRNANSGGNVIWYSADANAARAITTVQNQDWRIVR